MRRPKPRPRQPHDAPHADQLREALARVAKGRTGREPSPLRIHVAAVFDRLEADRERGATWDGLAEPFAALGILTAEGKAPTGSDLKNAFHAERYSRLPKRPRASKPKAAASPAPPAPAMAPAALEPARPVPAPAPSAPQEPPSVPAPPAMPVADPELARRLNSLRTIEEVPAMALPAGWRKRKGDQDG